MKIGSVMLEPITTMEAALHDAVDKQKALKEALIATIAEVAKVDEVIVGYRRALALLQEESNKI
jgi:hypothetical protein